MEAERGRPPRRNLAKQKAGEEKTRGKLAEKRDELFEEEYGYQTESVVKAMEILYMGLTTEEKEAFLAFAEKNF